MALGLTYDASHVRTAGIASWKVQKLGDTGFANLGSLRNGKITVIPITDRDSYARNRPYVLNVIATAQMRCTDKTGVLQLLHLLGADDMETYITAIDAKTFKLVGGGFHWKFNVDTGPRNIDVSCGRLIQHDDSAEYDLTDLLTSTSPAALDPADDLYGFSAATEVAAGLKTFEAKITTDSTYEESGPIKHGKLTAESVTFKNDYGAEYIYAVKIDLEVDCAPTSAELALIKSELDLDYRVTLKDGTVFTFDNILGAESGFHNEADSTDTSFIKYTATGIIPTSSWAALIT